MEQEAVLQVPMDAEVKEKVEALYAAMGTTFAEAVRMFAAQSLLIQGMPLSLRAYSRRSPAFGMLSEYADPELRKREDEILSRLSEENDGDTSNTQ
ncbi:MAG: type II toxin-antitoxin system RelB/DinJ family antitoxin [Oscillibacter sp.]|nr:type II toxin-antitoxin system RelB/DinJ family antitoxin [Oscillibacter sp.]